MDIKIYKCPDKKFKPYIIRSAKYYSEKLIPSKKMRDNIKLQIKFKPDLDHYGSTLVTGYNESEKAREFLIELHSGIGARSILETLAHEMVHVRQFVYGETNESLNKWKGEKIDHNATDYYSFPWEIEAHGVEVGLFTNFVINEKLWEVFEGINNLNAPIDTRELGWKK